MKHLTTELQNRILAYLDECIAFNPLDKEAADLKALISPGKRGRPLGWRKPLEAYRVEGDVTAAGSEIG